LNTSATYSERKQYGVYLAVYTSSSEPIYIVIPYRVRVVVRYG
jgi:hypothetical protein